MSPNSRPLVDLETSMCHCRKDVKPTTMIVDTGGESICVTDTSSLEYELSKFGLSGNEARVYLLLVAHKQLRIQQIATLSGLPRSSVYEVIKRLFEFGIAEEVIGESYKVIRPYSIGAMHHGLDEEMLRMQRLKSDLTALEQTIQLEPPEKQDEATTMRYYKDRSGARQLYWNTLSTSDEVYVYSDWGRGRYVGMRFYERFVEESRIRSTKEKVLINPTSYALESIRQYTFPGSAISRTRLEDIRVLDESVIKIKGDTLMYDDIYATVYLKNVQINGFEIESKHFADTQRSIFETLWAIAKPIQDYI